MPASGDAADTPPFDGDEKINDDDRYEDEVYLPEPDRPNPDVTEGRRLGGLLAGMKEPTTAPILELTDVVRKGPAVYLQGRASFPANTADALIENIVLGKEMTDFELFFDEDETDDGSPKDVDKGWAWMVLLGGFCAFSILSGLFNTVSIYYVVFQEAFGKSKHYTAWASSLHCAFSFLGGPLSSVMIMKFGCRWTIISGGLLSAVGYIGTSFAPNLETVFFTYGVITALGLNLNLSGWVIALGTYFNKKHSIATALGMTGFGCGLFFLGPGMEANVNQYGWRGSLIINAGIALHFCVFGALVYPITFTGYLGEDDLDEDGNFERKFFKDWEETQSLPPPEHERLSIDMEKPPLQASTEDDVDRKISTLGELKAPPASFMRPNAQSTMSVDTGLKRTAFAYVPGTTHISELRTKRTHSSASIRSMGSSSSLQCGSMQDFMFSPAAAFMSHSIRSLTEISGQPKGRRPYIAVGPHKQFSSNSSLPCLVGSRESVRSLDEDFRARASSFKDESTARASARGTIYRKPQIVEDDECIAEDLIKTLNDPQVVSLKPKKPGKGKKGGKHKTSAGLTTQQSVEVKEEPGEAKEDDAEKESVVQAAVSLVPIEEAETEKLLSSSPGKTSEGSIKVESGSETGDQEEDDDDDDPEEVWKLKAAMKAAARTQPPKSSFLRFFMPSYDANPRAISNIEEVDEAAMGSSYMSLNAIFKRKSREVLSRLTSDSDLKSKQHDSPCTGSQLPDIKEEKKFELSAITEEEEKKKKNKEPADEERLSEKDLNLEATEKSAESLALAAEGSDLKLKTPKQVEEAAPVEVGEAQGPWKTHLKSLWQGENPDDVPLFKDIRFWCFNYSGMVWIMGTLTLYVLYKDFAQEKNMVDRFIYALSGLGLGDLVGRLFSGTFVSWSFINSVLVYGLVQLACGIIILYHMTIRTSEEFIILCVCLGVCYGTQNVLLAVAPGEVYGSSHLTIVFGYILFFCGIGAIMGPPMASLLVQHFQDYSAVFIFAGVSTLTGGVATLLCFYIDWIWRRAKEKKRKEGLGPAGSDFQLAAVSSDT